MISVNDLIRVKTFFQRGSNEALMVSHWVVSAIDTMPSNAKLAEAFGDRMMKTGGLEGIMHTSAKLSRVVIDDLTDEIEFGEWNGELFGQNGTDPLPDFTAYSVKQVVGTRTTRHGYKRIPFGLDAFVSGNTLTIGAVPRGEVEAFFSGETLIEYHPGLADEVNVLLRAVIVGNRGTPEAPFRVINDVVSADMSRPTTQNTRKI